MISINRCVCFMNKNECIHVPKVLSNSLAERHSQDLLLGLSLKSYAILHAGNGEAGFPETPAHWWEVVS